MSKKWKYGPRVLFVSGSLFAITFLVAQNPVFQPAIDIDQQKLLKGCPIATDSSCAYPLKDVLNSGGDFWTTPFQPYDPATGKGDGYGEGVNGPRAAQRHYFNPRNSSYRFLRLNGLDSQSCFECHNSTGSETVDSRGALIRKPYGVAGSAGSNSNAFINPLYPMPETLFIRNPPAVFGSGYQQAVAEEMTLELFLLRARARQMAKLTPGKPYDQALSAKGVKFGDFITTFNANSPAKVIAPSTCNAGVTNPLSIGGVAGYTDDLTKLDGVSCDLVVRPFQWKGVSSGLRHFVRDALDFHFSMQAFEKVALCDCDGDGKGTPATGPEVTIGQVTATVSFVAMTRPPVQLDLSTASEKRGQDIFFGKGAGLYQNMCANCHLGPFKLLTPNVLIEWPTNPLDETAAGIDPNNPDTWPIKPSQCPNGIPPAKANACPVESSYSASTHSSSISPQNRGGLVSPVVSSQQLSIVHRFNANVAALQSAAAFHMEDLAAQDQLALSIKKLRAPLSAEPAKLSTTSRSATPAGVSVVGQDYVIPLSPPDSAVTAFQLPRLPVNADGTVDVPLFSDLKRHNMGKFLADPPPPLPSQGTDVANINTDPVQYLTRPLWGVADTGPWLHDGRALTLSEAILMHGDTSSGSGSDAAPVIDVFEKLSASDQQALVDFLLTLRLPPPKGAQTAAALAGQ
jgi:hypothetical protein